MNILKWFQQPAPSPSLPRDLSTDEATIYGKVRDYTMTSPESVASLVRAVDYVVNRGIPGDIVECGVWRGGSMMAVALRLLQLGAVRPIHLFDTFEGMSEPTKDDFDHRGVMATDREDAVKGAVAVGIEGVRAAMQLTGYSNYRCIKGMVEDTIPVSAPERIALLRLDTDFYESTKHELAHLYHRVSPGGIVFIDDYGHWMGCKKAVDEFLEALPVPVYLFRITYTVRAFVKVG